MGDTVHYSTPLELGAYYQHRGITPAAGANYETAVAAIDFQKIRIERVQFQLTTDATVINRRVSYVLFDGVGDMFGLDVNATQAAGIARVYRARVEDGNATTTIGGIVYTTFLKNCLISPNDPRLRINIDAIQPGDTITNIRLSGRFWAERTE